MSAPVLEQLSPALTAYQVLQPAAAPSAVGPEGEDEPPVEALPEEAGGGAVVVPWAGVVDSPPSLPPAGALLGAPPPTLPMVASSQPWVSASVQPIRRLATSVA